MSYLRRPIGDRIHTPLLAGLAWAGATTAAALVIGGLIVGGGWVVTLVMSWFGETSPSIPWHLVRAVLAALTPFIIAASAWASAYGSSTQATIRRTLAATAIGVILAIVGIRWMPGAASLLAFGSAWSLAIPFEGWWRVVARLIPTVVAATVAAIAVSDPGGASLVAVIIGGIIVAAPATWVGDQAWRLTRRFRSGGQDNEDDERRQ